MKEKIKQSLKWIFIGRQLQFLLSIVFQLLIMRILNPRIYGVYALAVSSLGFIAFFVSFGFPHSIIQFQKLKNIERNVLFLSILQGAVYICLTLPGALIVKAVYGGPVATIYLLLIPVHSVSFVSLVFQFAIERELEFKKTEIILSLTKFSSVLITLLLAIEGMGIYSLVAGFYVKTILEALIFFRFSRWRYGIGWNRDVIRTIVIYASKRFLARGCGVLMSYLDKLILGLIVPVAFVGVYERGLFIISSVLGLLGQINARFAYSLINRIKHNLEKTVSLINRGVLLNLVLGSGFALVAVVYLKPLIIFFLGEKWLETAILLPYFSIYLIAIIPGVFIRQVFYAEKDPLHIVWGRLMEIGFFLLVAGVLYQFSRGENNFMSLKIMAVNLGFSTMIGGGYLSINLLRLKQLKPMSLIKPAASLVTAAVLGWILATPAGFPVPAAGTVSVLFFGISVLFLCRTDFAWLKRFWEA